MATGSKSARMTPLLGLAFLTSAIRRMGGRGLKARRGNRAAAEHRRAAVATSIPGCRSLPWRSLRASRRRYCLGSWAWVQERKEDGSAISYQLSAISYQLSAFSNSRCYILACVLVCCFAIGLFPSIALSTTPASVSLRARRPRGDRVLPVAENVVHAPREGGIPVRWPSPPPDPRIVQNRRPLPGRSLPLCSPELKRPRAVSGRSAHTTHLADNLSLLDKQKLRRDELCAKPRSFRKSFTIRSSVRTLTADC